MNNFTVPVWVVLPAAAFLLGLAGTWCVRYYALRNNVLDIPSDRSSHFLPTPRGGGLSIALSALISLGVMYYVELITLDMLLGLGGGGLIVAIVGWLDDHRPISPLLRGFIYTAAAIWTIYFLGGMTSVKLGEYFLTLPVWGNLFAVLGLVWLINLYNFMDGTDALAAIQSICAGIFLGVFFLQAGHQELACLCFVIVAATSGFLYWNWPPAKIFMGDAGSCVTGFYFGCLGILGEKTGSVPVLVCFILLAVFICDATLTLLMRMLKREKWYSAHRSHAYQRLVQMGVSHMKLATGLLAINIILLWPMAYIAYRWQQLSSLIAVLTIILMCLLWAGIQVRYNRYSVMEK